MSAPDQDHLSEALAWFWHPVVTSAELEAAGGVLGTCLLGRELVVARIPDGTVAVLVDRCPHRSTRLSLGTVDGNGIRCAYHGWRWDSEGRCVEIPSAPGLPIPARFCQEAFDGAERHGLVWARLRPDATTTIPPLPAVDDSSMRIVAGEPYTWPTSAPRRVENFVDFAHFAWVHDGTLGLRSEPVPPECRVERVCGELRFDYQPPAVPSQAATALIGASRYRMPMPLTVDIEFEIAGRAGSRRHLWMTAAPLDARTCRTYWSVARNDEHDRPDDEYLAFQRLVLEEDRPVVCGQVPPEMPLELREEFHVKADKISVEYRRWLLDLIAAARLGSGAIEKALDIGAGRPMIASPDLAHLPKAHLHIHLEGAMRLATLAQLADDRGLPVPPVRSFIGFGGFIEQYVAATQLLDTEQRLRRVVREVVEDAAADGVSWVEPAFYPPRYRQLTGSDQATIEIVLDEIEAAGNQLGVGCGLIVAADRTIDPGEAVALAKIAGRFAGRGVVGFGLGNDETGHPPEPFAEAFSIAVDAGLLAVPHGGELEGPASVASCLDACRAHRVMHGVRAAESPDLVARLADEGVCLDVCPSSNVALSVVPSIEEHPLPALIEAGVHCSLNADDPLLFGPGILDEYRLCRERLELDDHLLARVAGWSLDASAAPPELVAAGHAGIDAWLATAAQ